MFLILGRLMKNRNNNKNSNSPDNYPPDVQQQQYQQQQYQQQQYQQQQYQQQQQQYQQQQYQQPAPSRHGQVTTLRPIKAAKQYFGGGSRSDNRPMPNYAIQNPQQQQQPPPAGYQPTQLGEPSQSANLYTNSAPPPPPPSYGVVQSDAGNYTAPGTT